MTIDLTEKRATTHARLLYCLDAILSSKHRVAIARFGTGASTKQANHPLDYRLREHDFTAS